MFLYTFHFYMILGFLVLSTGFTANKCIFRAAVYEHAYHLMQLFSMDPIKGMMDNLEVYSKQVIEASKQGAQIIVFPEMGITGLVWSSKRSIYYQVVPNPTDSEVPCLDEPRSNKTMVAYKLSCMARDNKVWLVANFPTRVNCTPNAPCPSRGAYHFNTDVVFDNNGMVVAVYHKYNLYGEETEKFDVPPKVDHIYFDTEFGRFGVITCFDLLWKEPIVTLVEKYKVDTLLFPTAWMDQLPYLVSVQAQAAFAHGLRVNLLAANMHLPGYGLMGSGLYSGEQGPVHYSYSEDSINGTLLVADMPCRSGGGINLKTSPFKDVALKAPIHHKIKYQNLSNFLSTVLNPSESSASLCQGSLCCEAKYKLGPLTTTGTYQLVVYQGTWSNRSVEICSVLWCHSIQELSSCTVQPTDDAVPILSLVLCGNFSTSHLYPSFLLNNLQLADPRTWNFKATKTTSHDRLTWLAELKTNNIKDTVRTGATTVSIYGRCYNPNVPSQATILGYHWKTWCLSLIIVTSIVV